MTSSDGVRCVLQPSNLGGVEGWRLLWRWVWVLKGWGSWGRIR
jgi:hypothetical protein